MTVPLRDITLADGAPQSCRCVALSWQAVLLGFAFTLNGLLSADNLFVFMLLLQKVSLHAAAAPAASAAAALLVEG